MERYATETVLTSSLYERSGRDEAVRAVQVRGRGARCDSASFLELSSLSQHLDFVWAVLRRRLDRELSFERCITDGIKKFNTEHRRGVNHPLEKSLGTKCTAETGFIANKGRVTREPGPYQSNCHVYISTMIMLKRTESNALLQHTRYTPYRLQSCRMDVSSSAIFRASFSPSRQPCFTPSVPDAYPSIDPCQDRRFPLQIPE